MEIRQLKYFLQLCEDLSFSKAASNLFLTQQALSQSIKNLELELGTPLFIRNKNGIEMTETAKYAYVEVETFLKKYDVMCTNLQDYSKAMKGEISIAIPPGMIHRIVPPVLTSFRDLYPDITVSVLEMCDRECEQGVYDGTFDLGVSVAPIDDNRFQFIPLVKDSAFVLLNRRNPLALKESVTFSDLKGQDIFVVDNSFKWHETVLKKCRETGGVNSFAYTSKHPSTLAELVNNNLGITILIPYEISKNITQDTLSVPIDESENFYYIGGIISKRCLPQRHIVQVLIDFLVEHFNSAYTSNNAI